MRICLQHGLYDHQPGGKGCPSCTAARSARRGTRRERGIGPNHELFARVIKLEEMACALCHHPYGDPNNPITVGHIMSRYECFLRDKDPDDPHNLRPECRLCNLSKGTS